MDRCVNGRMVSQRPRPVNREPRRNPGPDAVRIALLGACRAKGFQGLPRSLELSITVNSPPSTFGVRRREASDSSQMLALAVSSFRMLCGAIASAT